MAGMKCVVFVVVLTIVISSAREDAEVSCVFMETCILPCSFQGGTDVVIHWNLTKTGGNLKVHSYYHNQDQLANQDQRFKNRTSLFRDQISGGNASLQLTGLKTQDQGRYRCYTSAALGITKFINLKVDAPVNKVDIQQVGNRITCSSEGIYPEPQLSWTTSPPSNVTLRDKPTVHQTDQQLYNISSSLIASDLDYSCTVSTRRNKRTATLFKPTSINVSNPETTISCTSKNTTLTSLIWRFNHSQIILNQTGTNVSNTVSEEWRQQVKSVSESGSLTLQHLSSNQEGTYTCELSDEEDTYVKHTNLKIIEDYSDTPQMQENIKIIIGVIVPILAVLIVGLVACCIYRNSRRPSTRTQGGAANTSANGQHSAEAHEMTPMARGGQTE